MIKSAYIHIPFCTRICTYCDFPKMLYDEKFANKYLDALKKEISLNYKDDKLSTIYIGGGTPTSFSYMELKKLLDILSIFKKEETIEYTVECNLDSITEEKLILMKEYGVNRISIGVETFQSKFLKYLNRSQSSKDKIKLALKYFDNINIDLMYALKDETIEDLKSDLEEFLTLGVKHISTYSLIIEPNTLLSIKGEKPISEELDLEMYKLICKVLKENGYNHYEISNFALDGYESKHNLTYWNNLEYYGFGMGASSYIDSYRITNTRSINKYINHDFVKEKEFVDKKLKMEYEMILGLRKIDGVDINLFKEKYGINIDEAFKIGEFLKEGKLIKENGKLKISEDYLYLSNDILINFVGE